MSDSSTLITRQEGLRPTKEPLRIAVRRLRWFRASFRSQTEVITENTGYGFEILEDRLTAAFISWLRKVEAQRPADTADRPAYFDFAAGLMLRELLSDPPLRVTHRPAAPDKDAPETIWPEGFVCTTFCLGVRAAVFAQEFDASTRIAPEFDEARTWWSFFENVGEDAARAAGFFQLFVGNEPDWLMPDVFHRAMFRTSIEPITDKPRLSDHDPS